MFLFMKNKERKFNINYFVKKFLLFVLLLALFLAPHKTLFVTDFVFSRIFKVDKSPLIGVPPSPLFKRPTLQTLKSSEFQKRFEDYFLRRSNLYKYLVKINNEISLGMFKQVSFLYEKADVFLGNDEVLIERALLK